MLRTSRMIAASIFATALALPSGARAQQATAPPPSPPPTSPDRPTLELSLDEAVKRTLENNNDIAVEKYNPELSEENIRLYRGYYDPVIGSTVSQLEQTSPVTSAFAGAQNAVDNNTTTYNFNATQLLKTGGTARVDFTNNRGSTNSVFNTFNPSYNSGLNARLSQPLFTATG